VAQCYRWDRPNVSSISVDGIEHKVNPDTGYLEVEVVTPGLAAELARWNAEQVDPTRDQTYRLSSDEETERQGLFVELEAARGVRIDRRRSLQQLRQMKVDLQAKT
jgi:hypothetical protein